MIWARMLAYITGTVDQKLLLRTSIWLRAQIRGRLLLSDAEKATLAKIAYRLERKALKEVAAAVEPDTLLALYRKLTAFQGSRGKRRTDGPVQFGQGNRICQQQLVG